MLTLFQCILGACLVCVAGVCVQWATCLAQNYLRARQMGLPIKIIPIDHMNPLWAVLDRKIVPLVKLLPFGLGNNSFTRYNFRGFELEDKTRSHDEMGDAFILVSPRYVWVYINDPESVMDCLRRKADFKHPIFMTEMLGIFGSNLSIVSELNLISCFASHPSPGPLTVWIRRLRTRNGSYTAGLLLAASTTRII
jgi:hypothetical protein